MKVGAKRSTYNKLQSYIKGKDKFGSSIELNIDGQNKLNSVFGGLFTVIGVYILTMYLAINEYLIITSYSNYNLKQSTIFYDKPPVIDFNQIKDDFAFGFRYKREPIDMLDNEYFTLKFVHESKES